MRGLTRGQTTLEYCILAVIVIGALIVMQVYLKRGIQGGWKESIDQLGDQYNPGQTNSVIIHSIESTSETRVQAIQGYNGITKGFYTSRTDNSSMTETKKGSTQIGY